MSDLLNFNLQPPKDKDKDKEETTDRNTIQALFSRYADQVWNVLLIDLLLILPLFVSYESITLCVAVWSAGGRTAPEAPEWQLPSRWLDLNHVCLFFWNIISFVVTHDTKSSSSFGDFNWSVCTVDRHPLWFWFGYLHEHDGHGGCILKRKRGCLTMCWILTYSTNHDTLSWQKVKLHIFFKWVVLNVQRPTKQWGWLSRSSQLSGRRSPNTRWCSEYGAMNICLYSCIHQ